MICPGCDAWIVPLPDVAAGQLVCPQCGAQTPHRFYPLCILTGASGAGKTAVLEKLGPLLPNWDLFETDILWDSGGDWRMVKHNWLRIAASLHRQSRPVLLSGTIRPDEIQDASALPFFSAVHFLLLDCDDAERSRRLRNRPAWRSGDEKFIADQLASAHWFRENITTRVDTTGKQMAETAVAVCDWTDSVWQRS